MFFCCTAVLLPACLLGIWGVDRLQSRIVNDNNNNSAVLGMETRYGDAVGGRRSAVPPPADSYSHSFICYLCEHIGICFRSYTLQQYERRRCLRLGDVSHSSGDLHLTCRPVSRPPSLHPSSPGIPGLLPPIGSRLSRGTAPEGPERRDGKRKRANGNANAPKGTQANKSAARIFMGAPAHHGQDEHASPSAHKHILMMQMQFASTAHVCMNSFIHMTDQTHTHRRTRASSCVAMTVFC